jgi:hypothetical protein
MGKYKEAVEDIKEELETSFPKREEDYENLFSSIVNIIEMTKQNRGYY